ncbi:MAG: hypothetical protein QXW94_04160, partial [Desulfurococcaceae archaeon]
MVGIYTINVKCDRLSPCPFKSFLNKPSKKNSSGGLFLSDGVQALAERLTKLKSIDKVVDLARSNIQLEMMFLLSSRGELSPNEIARLMGQRRKAVTDALRKLRLKDVVEEVESAGDKLYRLSPFGERCLEALLEATGLKALALERQDLYRVEHLDGLIRNMPLFHYVFECTLALGLAGEGMSVDRLANIVNLSPQRLRTYLDVFTGDANPRLFRRYEVPTLLSTLLQRLGLKYRRLKTF